MQPADLLLSEHVVQARPPGFFQHRSFPDQLGAQCGVAEIVFGHSPEMRGVRQIDGIAEGFGKRLALPQHLQRNDGLALRDRDVPVRPQRGRSLGARRGIGCQRTVQPVPAFAKLATTQPVPEQVCRHLQRGPSAIRIIEHRAEDGANIDLFVSHPPDQVELVGSEPVALEFVCQPAIVGAVPPAHGRFFTTAAQLLPAVLGDGLQQPVALVPLGDVARHDRLVDQCGQVPGDILSRKHVVTTDALRGAQHDPSREHRKAFPQPPFRFGAQLVAPFQRGSQRVVPWRGRAVADVEKIVTMVEPVEQRRRRERAHPNRGQFDRQRQTVQTRTQFHDVRGVLGGDPEVRVHRNRTLAEQLDRLGRSGVPIAVAAVDGERRNEEDMLPADPQRFAAGDQDAQRRAGRQQISSEHRALVEEVLAVVQNQQQIARPQILGERPYDILVSHREPQRLRDRKRDQSGVGDAGELHQGHAVGERPLRLAGDLRGQTGFSDPTDSDQRDQPRGSQQPAHLGRLGPAPDETRQVGGQQVARPRRRRVVHGLTSRIGGAFG